MDNQPLEPREIEAALAAHKELGAEYEPALVASFAEKIRAEVQRQVDEERSLETRRNAEGGGRLALAIVSLALAIPLTAIALGTGWPWMVLVSWIGIVAVNVAYAMRRKDR